MMSDDNIVGDALGPVAHIDTESYRSLAAAGFTESQIGALRLAFASAFAEFVNIVHRDSDSAMFDEIVSGLDEPE